MNQPASLIMHLLIDFSLIFIWLNVHTVRFGLYCSGISNTRKSFLRLLSLFKGGQWVKYCEFGFDFFKCQFLQLFILVIICEDEFVLCGRMDLGWKSPEIFKGTIPILRQQRNWVGGVRKMTIFADVQCYSCWHVSEKVKKCADVI